MHQCSDRRRRLLKCSAVDEDLCLIKITNRYINLKNNTKTKKNLNTKKNLDKKNNPNTKDEHLYKFLSDAGTRECRFQLK